MNIKILLIFIMLAIGVVYFLKFQKMQEEYIVVFTKEVSEEKAKEILKSYNIEGKLGSDSSKGKVYFYTNGPHFRVNIDTKILRTLEKDPNVFEVYKPNLEAKKD